MASVHAFEAAGLGKAPFRYLYMYELPSASLGEANPSAYNAALALAPRDVGCGTCNFCGMAITRNFIVESADGKRSAVGADCVEKTCGTALVAAVKKEVLKVARVKRRAKAQVAADARAAAWREANRERLEREAAERVANSAAVLAAWGHMLPVLDARPGQFCADMAANIRSGRAPVGRAVEILEQIWAKRPNSRRAA